LARRRRLVVARAEVAHDTGDDETAGDVTVLRVFGPGQDGARLRRR
jgi:hypothetical protein